MHTNLIKKYLKLRSQTAAAKPQECIFIDDIEQYTEAARTMGINAHTFTTPGKLEQFLNEQKIIKTG